MIYGHINNRDTYEFLEIDPFWRICFEHIKEINSDIPTGIYNINSNAIKVNIMNYNTRNRNGCKYESHLRNIDLLVHLAAFSAQPPYENLQNCIINNVLGPINLFEKGFDAGIRKFLVTGSCFEYGLSANSYELIPPTAKHLVFLGSISLIALKVFGPILEAGKNFKASAPELSANNASEAVKQPGILTILNFFVSLITSSLVFGETINFAPVSNTSFTSLTFKTVPAPMSALSVYLLTNN